MSIPHSLLTLLSTETSSHGFALKRRYDHLLGGDRDLKAGQVYSTLARLERDGLAHGVGFESGGAAERRLYAITDAGVTEVETWLITPTLPGGRPSELFTKVILALASGRDPGRLLDRQRDVYLARLREITAARHANDTIGRLSGDFESAHLNADLTWIETAIARLPQLRVDVTGEPR